MTNRLFHNAMTVVLIICFGLLLGCQPSDRTPGLWLRGDIEDLGSGDWSFTNTFKEIAVQVSTPYLLPHSVTIWCAESDGELFIGARSPETKRWPKWLENDPDIWLKIDGSRYAVTAETISDAATTARVGQAYREKYNLGDSGDMNPKNFKFWRVHSRAP